MKKGFTLIELLVVIAIIGLLTTLMISLTQKNNDESVGQVDINTPLINK